MPGTLIAQVEDVRVVDDGDNRFVLETQGEDSLGDKRWEVEYWMTGSNAVVVFAKRVQALEALVKKSDESIAQLAKELQELDRAYAQNVY